MGDQQGKHVIHGVRPVWQENLQLGEARGKLDADAFVGEVDLDEVGLDEGDEQLSARGGFEFQQGGSAKFVDSGDDSEGGFVLEHGTADQVLMEKFVGFGLNFFFRAYQHFGALPGLGGGDAVNAGELKNRTAGVMPEACHVEFGGTYGGAQQDVLDTLCATGVGTIDLCDEFTDSPAGAQKATHGDPVSGTHLFENLQGKATVQLHARCP
jgi:hypothetical protein